MMAPPVVSGKELFRRPRYFSTAPGGRTSKLPDCRRGVCVMRVFHSRTLIVFFVPFGFSPSGLLFGQP